MYTVVKCSIWKTCVCVLKQNLKFQKFVHYFGGGSGHHTYDHAVKVFLISVINLTCNFLMKHSKFHLSCNHFIIIRFLLH